MKRKGGVCGVIRGVGLQKAGAIVCAVCMYCVGGPVGLSLLLATPLAVSEHTFSPGSLSWEVVCSAKVVLTHELIFGEERAAKRTEIKMVGSCQDFSISEEQAADEGDHQIRGDAVDQDTNSGEHM
ncbi:unnamed protein product [Dibothriocephalus latus]|uniref:Uncharacterized protein n=1 Tax=Dibothriocephalus latus TaxID=60516 RepID=A0A3P7LEC5_DIBLA|nr:unnamed protein product [Dibothriocephalus latus]